MKKILLLLLTCVVVISGQTWVSRARVRDHTEFFSEVIQETVYELERRGWCNLKMIDINQNINLQMYKWLVNGTVLYTNGFVVSMQKLDVTNMNQNVQSVTIDGVAVPRASVSGRLNMRDVVIGYDVIANLTDLGEQRYTGDIPHILINWDFTIAKNWVTKEVTVSSSYGTSGGNGIRMIYRPANNVTEVLSRNFYPYDNNAGVGTWRDTFNSIILDVVTNKVPFPEVCFSNC